MLLAIFGLKLSPQAAHASQSNSGYCGPQACHAEGDTYEDTFSVTIEETDTGSTEGASGSGGPREYTTTRRTYVAACTGNAPNAFLISCTNATSCPDPGHTRVWQFEQTYTVRDGVEVDTEPWRRVGPELCRPAPEAPAPTIGEFTLEVSRGFTTSRPAEPDLDIRPFPVVLVNARNAFAAGAADPVQLTSTALGRQVVITATPISWNWDFGDGTTRTTDTPGRAGELEVTHTYTRTGDVPVTVTVTWSGTFTVAGLPGSYDIDGTAQVTSAPVTLSVREARTELVDQ